MSGGHMKLSSFSLALPRRFEPLAEARHPYDILVLIILQVWEPTEVPRLVINHVS
jgi:hypothetical protein